MSNKNNILNHLFSTAPPVFKTSEVTQQTKSTNKKPNNMYESVLIEDDMFCKKVKSNLGESYYVCNEIDMDDLSKSEYDIVLEQDNYAKYKKVKKYIKKGGAVFSTSHTLFGAAVSAFALGKYIFSFL